MRMRGGIDISGEFELHLKDYIRIAYKKLKSYIFFDKAQLPLRDKIVEYETSGIKDGLDELYDMLSGENETWDAFEANVINKINALVYPKKLNGASENDKEARYVDDIIIVDKVEKIVLCTSWL